MRKQCKECKQIFETDFEWQKICKVCYRNLKQKELNECKTKINELEYELKSLKNIQPFSKDKKFIKQLIQLCHPDKHENSKIANEITIQLIKLLKEL